MTKEIRHDEYVRKLLEDRKKETIKMDPVNARGIEKGEGITSPASNLSTEETRLLKEYMKQKNLLKVTEADTTRKKTLTLKKFLKMKRNQQVEVYSNHGDKHIYTEGKVNAVGRDFVMLTNLKDRVWIPYHAVHSANIPYGIPNYSNTHQHFLYDNNLREKLLYDFGATVSKREVLLQQFNEESLRTNLNRWKGTWVEVKYGDSQKCFGKIIETTKEHVIIATLNKKIQISLNQLAYIETLRFLQILSKLFKKG